MVTFWFYVFQCLCELVLTDKSHFHCHCMLDKRNAKDRLTRDEQENAPAVAEEIYEKGPLPSPALI